MKIKILPTYQKPILHPEAFKMSFENILQLKKIYREIIGMHEIDHVSINIVNPNQQMSILSFNPAIAYSIVETGTYIYNGSISPDFYTKKSFYTWEESYDPRAKDIIKPIMQLKHGIEMGCVIVKKIKNHHVLFSFAKKKNGIELYQAMQDNLSQYSKIGDFLLSQISPVYSQYCKNEKELLCLATAKTKLKLVVNNRE